MVGGRNFDQEFLTPQDGKTADGKTEDRPHEDVRWVVGGRSEPREPDGGGEAIGDKRNPPVALIPLCDYGSYRKRGDCVAGWKASARAERGTFGIKPIVRQIGAFAEFRRFSPNVDGFDRIGHNFGIDERFGRKPGCFFCPRVRTDEAEGIEGNGHGHDGDSRRGPAQCIVESLERRIVMKIGRRMGIACDQGPCSAENGKRRDEILPVDQPNRERPYVFLVGCDIREKATGIAGAFVDLGECG